MGVREKLLVMGVSFALFVAGVIALYAMTGAARSYLLAGVFAGLVAIALWQTWRLVRRSGRNK